MKNKQLLKQVADSKIVAEQKLQKFSTNDRLRLEKKWDVEHAYHSSKLEGSQLSKQDFDELAKSVK